MNRALFQNVFRDLALVSAAFLLSLAAGFLLNRLRSDPLPFPYRGREARLLAAVPGVGKEPRGVLLAEAEVAWRSRTAVFVDAREPDFFEEAHIPGAINLPVSEIAAIHGLPDDKAAPLIVYCSDADCSDSRIVAKAISAAGYQNAAVFAGGWDAWTAARLPQ